MQPIVENAIHYGLEGKQDGGTVTLKVFETEQKLIIQIKDNGLGMSQETLEYLQKRLAGQLSKKNESGHGSGIALVNVHQRIRLFFGEKYGISVISAEGIGTIVEVSLPKETSIITQFQTNG